jgi:hypothetical protein
MHGFRKDKILVFPFAKPITAFLKPQEATNHTKNPKVLLDV